jgi:L-ribulose-5-phosphate 3-epimerase
MRSVKPMEVGLVFWAEQNAEANLRQLKDFDIYSGQLGVPPDLRCDVVLDDWVNGLSESQVSITSAVCCYMGEDYANLETIHKTVGFTTESLRLDRIARTKEVSEFARAIEIPALSCHIGFIPSNTDETLYKDLCDLTKLLCDYCGNNGQNFVLETGQESADVLLSFIHNVNRQNLRVNFDPANMIMYKSGDPLAALEIVSAHVSSVHCKDAYSPVAGTGRLGEECTLGDGEVDFPSFLQKLKKLDYRGALSIEREELNIEKRIADIKTGILRLKGWKANLDL